MRCQNSKTEPFHVPLVVPGEPYASPALPAAGPVPGPVVDRRRPGRRTVLPAGQGLRALRGRAQCTGCGLVRRGRRAFAGAPRPDQWRERAGAARRRRRGREPSSATRAATPGCSTAASTPSFASAASAWAANVSRYRPRPRRPGSSPRYSTTTGASGSPAAAASTVASTQPGAWWRSGPRPRARRRTASASPRTARSGTRRTTRWCMSIRSTAAPSGCPRLKARRPCADRRRLHRQALGQRQRWRPAVPLRSQRCLVAELAAAGQPGPPGQPAGRRHGPCLAARRRQRGALAFRQ